MITAQVIMFITGAAVSAAYFLFTRPFERAGMSFPLDKIFAAASIFGLWPYVIFLTLYTRLTARLLDKLEGVGD